TAASASVNGEREGRCMCITHLIRRDAHPQYRAMASPSKKLQAGGDAVSAQLNGKDASDGKQARFATNCMGMLVAETDTCAARTPLGHHKTFTQHASIRDLREPGSLDVSTCLANLRTHHEPP
ncbi:hypothetical protein, partial [Stenotrophomonas maltophilia]|uniref:hypothetical protein n=1 Tax=Stenotrophomonas maltophilia TaxID=40324 RepID=UPI0039C381FD